MNMTDDYVSNSTDLIVETSTCDNTAERYASKLFPNITLAVPEWEAIVTAISLSVIIVLTIIGNILVILSVFTYKPLRIVQNFFIVSLAVADLTVAVLVLPFNVALSISGQWQFGIHVCKMWLTCDILCCTASILNLCAIALDRYWAITDPINYAQKRTLKRVLIMIAGLWGLSGTISSPPLIGWNDWPDEFNASTPCELTRQQGYVVYSSLGSFFIPLFIMTIVYIEIFIATKRRLRERARASKLNTVKQNVMSMNQHQGTSRDQQMAHDQESVSSETNHNEPLTECVSNKEKKRKSKKKRKKNHGDDKTKDRHSLAATPVSEDSITNDNLSTAHGRNAQNPHRNTITVSTELQDSPQSRGRCVGETSTRPYAHEPAASTSTAAPNTLSGKKNIPVYAFIEEKQRISLSKERRAARTLGIIMGVFVVCWLPFFLMYVIMPFCTTCCPSKKVVNFFTWLGYVNSALNPIIYTIFNMDFRRAFKKILHIEN